MCLNTEIGVSYVCSYVYVLFLRKVKVDLHVCQCRVVVIQAENAQSSVYVLFLREV
jgi:hypothetical protein